MNTLLVLLIVIIITDYLFDLILDVLNLRNRNMPIPKLLDDVYQPDKYRLQQGYEVETSKFSFIQGFLGLVLTLIVLYYGVLGSLHEWISSFGFERITSSLIFFGFILFAMKVLALPFSYWSTFVIEEKYGFNRTTPKLFFIDILKSMLLTIVIGGGLLALIIWIFYSAGQWFWLIALIVVVAFSLIANTLYSTLIVPLFNKQEPLKEGELLDAIKDLAAKVRFPVSKVFVIDGSKRSTKANAYFSGFGKSRRVVLYDTLIQEMNTEEILAVLAHEVGHYKKRHIWINLGLGVVQSAVMLYIFGRMSTSTDFSVALGYHQATEPVFHLSLIAFGILFNPIETIIGLLTNMLSRRMEYQADAFAAGFNLGGSLVNGLKKLSAKNFSNLTPHPAYVFVNYSHPTLKQRIERILSYKKSF